MLRPPHARLGQECVALLVQPQQAPGVPRQSPVPHTRMLVLMEHARLLLTDSRGSYDRAFCPSSLNCDEVLSACLPQMTDPCSNGHALRRIADVGMST